MTTPLDQTRAEFEARPEFVADPGLLQRQLDGKSYVFTRIQGMWEGWQAAIASRWTNVADGLPPCRDDQLYIGVNSLGYAGVFNAVADIAGDVHCMYETPEESVDVMSDLAIWQPFNPPTPPTAAEAAKETT